MVAPLARLACCRSAPAAAEHPYDPDSDSDSCEHIGAESCDNSRIQRNLFLHNHQHKRLLHSALKSADYCLVAQLLLTGMQFCTAGYDSCFVYILKYCDASFLDSALTMNPDAVHCRGGYGYTLLMQCDNVEKMQVILKHGPDLQAVNDDGDDVLLEYVKHLLVEVMNLIQSFDHLYFEDLHIFQVFAPAVFSPQMHATIDKRKALIDCILESGVNVNSSGALKSVLGLFSIIGLGHVNYRYYHDGTIDELHSSQICYMEHDLAAHTLYKILQAEPIIPPPDENGVTSLMLACKSPWNFDSIKLLVERGEDVNAKDDEGRNAIHYLLQYFVCHCCAYNCRKFEQDKAPLVDKILVFLCDHGSKLQGMDIKMIYRFEEKKKNEYTVLKYLMSIKESCLNKRDFSGKLQIKNDANTCTFLDLFLEYRECMFQENPMKLDLKDVAVLAKEISQGLDVRQRLVEPWDYDRIKDSLWSAKLLVPDALRRVLFMQTMEYSFGALHPDRRIHPGKKYFKALDGVQRLLLPFWPHPPLALLIFLPCCIVDCYVPAECRCRKLVYHLYYIGGPLNPGSELYHATRQAIESTILKYPGLQKALQAFDQLHEEIPSLLQLSRTALRASLKNVDTEGLDVSSLKVWFEGELRSLPTPIRKYLNFGKLPVKPAFSS